MVISGVSRLRELAAAFDKRRARADGSKPTPEDHAARAALKAVELAVSKYEKRDSDRRQLAQKAKREVPARRLPAEFRCVKVATDVKTVDALEFSCSVSDYTLEAAASPSGEDQGSATRGSKAGGTGRETGEERCAKYAVWKAEYDRHYAHEEGKAGGTFFDDFLPTALESFGVLEKLRRHLHAVGGETGRAREAIERKATTT